VGNDANAYWERWQKLVEAAANFQGLLSGSILIGGSAAALHLKHRYSFDADHILIDLADRYQEVLEFLEGRDDWQTARIHPPKMILGNFQGVETGIRQLRRRRPLETEVIDRAGKSLTVPTLLEMLRIKGWMVISRNATRDFIDFAALAKHVGIAEGAAALKDFDSYYVDLVRGENASPVVQLVRQLAEPAPYDLDAVDTSLYKGIKPPFDRWNTIIEMCGDFSVALANILV
jgi:hypothetical protein